MRNVLGLDIGISSVGWGIIDLDSNKVVDAGVRLFTEATKENNEQRRDFRGGRRLKRRRVNRKKDLTNILKSYGLYSEYPSIINPYDARCKGLYHTLTKEELNAALFHICKHRGSSLEVIEDDEKKVKDANGTKSILAENDKLIKSGKYVCEIQKERLLNRNKIRGIDNNFRSTDYEKELEQLLKTQQIQDDAKEAIISCILRRRHFDEGPGSFKSQTPYGRIYDENGKVVMGMIDKMRGKCSIYPEEPRAPKKAPSAEFFNLLNDLNNLKVSTDNNEPLDLDVKQNLVSLAFEKGSITVNQIAKYAEVSAEELSGFRIDENSKPLITKLEGFKAFKKVFDQYGYSYALKNFDLLDNLADILTKTKIKEERKIQIKEVLAINSIECDAMVEELSELAKFTAYHSLSFKALKQLNDELYNSTMNQMQVLQLSGHFEFAKNRGNQKGKRNISIKEEAILSPVAMRSYRQAIKVVNAVRRKYGEMESIVVETTRDKNSSEKKKRISETQKYYKKANDEVDKILEGYPGIKANSKLRTKIRLYMEQNAKTAYAQYPIDLNLLITDPRAYEIDHIIPISISLDDSINNKALVTQKENQEKGQLTPIMAFELGKFTQGSIDSFKQFALDLYKKDSKLRKKYYNYVYSKDITKYDNMKEFIARNLVDTSYANRLVFNTLKDYFDDNGIDTKVHTIKGQATSAFRKRIKGLEKDRDEDYRHHAIDALVVASIKKLNLYNRLLKDFQVTNDGDVYRKETGELIESNDDLLLDDKYMQFLEHLVSLRSSYDENASKESAIIKFSHQIDTKPNRSIADQTIYSTRNYGEGDVVIKKFKNIYDPKFNTLANDILNNKSSRYLMAKHDPQTFDKITALVNYYYEQFKKDKSKVKEGKKGEIELTFNPLAIHLEETGEYITKYSKKGNGPIITSMKYTDGKLGSHVDISSNYILKNKKVVLQQISPYRTDFYFDNGVYKFVTVRYSNIQYSEKEKEYFIKEDWYNEQKKLKKISEKATFCFSMHRNEMIEITDGKGTILWKFTGTNDDNGNIIEVKPVDRYAVERYRFSIGKKIKSLAKYSCDSLGKLTKIDNSVLKLRFK